MRYWVRARRKYATPAEAEAANRARKREWADRHRDDEALKRRRRSRPVTLAPVSDVRYLAHLRPTGWYVAEFFARVIR